MNLNRRSFLSRFGSIVASVAIAQSVVKSWVREPDLLFNPADYRGAWRFVCDVDTAGWLTMIPPDKFPENTGVENPDWFYAPKEVVRYEPPRGRFVMVT